MSFALSIIQNLVDHKYQQKQHGPFKPVEGCYHILEVTYKKGVMIPDIAIAKAVWKESKYKMFVTGTEKEISLSFLFSKNCQYPRSLNPKDLEDKVIHVKYANYKCESIVVEWDIIEDKKQYISKQNAGTAFFQYTTLGKGADKFYESQSEEVQDALMIADCSSNNVEDYVEDPDPYEYTEDQNDQHGDSNSGDHEK